MSELLLNLPNPVILINSLRSIGYSFEEAIADIIDNSITAKANTIKIMFPQNNDVDMFVSICDNGIGMDKNELINAMRYGSDYNDAKNGLGRFGMGLKTASLSQCCKMTVISKKDNELNAASWDIDIIKKYNSWTMQILDDTEISKIPNIKFLDKYNSGTIVLWQKFDLISKKDDSILYDKIATLIEKSEKHIALVFHRFMNPIFDKIEQINVFINSYKIIPLDPFLSNHNKTTTLNNIVINFGDESIFVQPYILPYIKDLSQDEEKLSGGIENYFSKQGFYIYRNKRLINFGQWFGAKKEELAKNARIKVDITNKLDYIWEVDIKKSKAVLPMSIRQQLKHCIDNTKRYSEKLHTHRGRKKELECSQNQYCWIQNVGRNENIYYTINRELPFLDVLKNQFSKEFYNDFEMFLKTIEETIPYQQIYIDAAKGKIDSSLYNDKKSEDIIKLARRILSLKKRENKENLKEYIDKLFFSEPFIDFQNIKNQILMEFDSSGTIAT